MAVLETNCWQYQQTQVARDQKRRRQEQRRKTATTQDPVDEMNADVEMQGLFSSMVDDRCDACDEFELAADNAEQYPSEVEDDQAGHRDGPGAAQKQPSLQSDLGVPPGHWRP